MERNTPEVKDAARVRAGQLGMRARWGPPRRLRIGDLTPAQRELVIGLIEAHRLANAARQRDDEQDAA